MNSKYTILIFGITLIIFLMALGYPYGSRYLEPTFHPSPSISVQRRANEDWVTHSNSKYGFEIKHPLKSFIDSSSRFTAETEYIRIQNYASNDQQSLYPGEYYLEIWIQNGSKHCGDIEGSIEVAISGSVGYRGVGFSEGDSGGVRQALCINQKEKNFYVQVTAQQETTADLILNSFKFL